MENRPRRGRPRKDPELAVRHGIMVQPRFPRALYPEIKAAAASEGLAITAWIRRLVCVDLAARRKKKSA
jgi:hypothetical protein